MTGIGNKSRRESSISEPTLLKNPNLNPIEKLGFLLKPLNNKKYTCHTIMKSSMPRKIEQEEPHKIIFYLIVSLLSSNLFQNVFISLFF